MPGGDFPIQDWLRRALQYPSLVIKDFRKGGTCSRPLIHFQVENLVMADAVVRYRHRLKAASSSEDKFAIFDVLSPEEEDIHSKVVSCLPGGHPSWQEGPVQPCLHAC